MKKRKIRTESGVWIPATYKTDRYERWKDKSKVDQNDGASDDSGDDEKSSRRKTSSRFDGGYQRRGVPMGMNLEGIACFTSCHALRLFEHGLDD